MFHFRLCKLILWIGIRQQGEGGLHDMKRNFIFASRIVLIHLRRKLVSTHDIKLVINRKCVQDLSYCFYMVLLLSVWEWSNIAWLYLHQHSGVCVLKRACICLFQIRLLPNTGFCKDMLIYLQGYIFCKNIWLGEGKWCGGKIVY